MNLNLFTVMCWVHHQMPHRQLAPMCLKLICLWYFKMCSVIIPWIESKTFNYKIPALIIMLDILCAFSGEQHPVQEFLNLATSDQIFPHVRVIFNEDSFLCATLRVDKSWKRCWYYFFAIDDMCYIVYLRRFVWFGKHKLVKPLSVIFWRMWK